MIMTFCDLTTFSLNKVNPPEVIFPDIVFRRFAPNHIHRGVISSKFLGVRAKRAEDFLKTKLKNTPFFGVWGQKIWGALAHPAHLEITPLLMHFLKQFRLGP